MKPFLLRLHRWTSILFALPLCVVIVTGLILSVQPMSQSLSITPGSIDAPRLLALLEKHDPQGQARGLAMDHFANRMRLVGGPGGEIDLVSGEKAQAPAPLAALFGWARRTHEHLIFDLGWLVTSSTLAMLVIIALGVLMGLPMLRNTVSGWHRCMAWFTLPLVIISPLTGLALAFGITFQDAPARTSGGRAAALPLKQAVEIVGRTHDLSRLNSLMTRGGRLMARIDEDGELRAYGVTAQGTTALPRNWPRLIHEGNWSSVLASVLNLVVSFVFMGLLSTGLIIWWRRTFKRRKKRIRA